MAIPNSALIVAQHGQEWKTHHSPNGQELTVRIAKPTAQLKHADENEVAHQRPLASEPIGQQPEDERTERSEEESEGDGGGDRLGAHVELFGEAK